MIREQVVAEKKYIFLIKNCNLLRYPLASIKEVAHPGLPRQEQSRLEGIVKLRFWGSREVGEKISR
jgi:hypothetical protein